VKVTSSDDAVASMVPAAAWSHRWDQDRSEADSDVRGSHPGPLIIRNTIELDGSDKPAAMVDKVMRVIV
jgi:hypothetical protein